MQEVVWGHSDINCNNSCCKDFMELEIMINSSVTYIMQAFGIINQQEHLPEILCDPISHPQCLWKKSQDEQGYIGTDFRHAYLLLVLKLHLWPVL